MAPKLRFCGQPLSQSATAGEFLREALLDADTKSLRIAVAWARFGGLIRMADELSSFRRRGGSSTLITGIDEGVATRPGLALALTLFDDVFLLHDRGGRTFHPKAYLLEGSSVARLFIGSSNLTAGGLYFNFEAGLEAEFTLPEEAGHDALASARSYLDALQGDAASERLDPALLETLASDPRNRIAGTERRDRGSADKDPDGLDETEGPAETAAGAPFAASSVAKSFPPPLSGAELELLQQLESIDVDVEEGSGASASVPAPAAPLSWSKKLAGTDAQHPPRVGSNPTGNLRLSNAKNPIDHQTWFRQELFGPQNWTSGFDSHHNPLERATVPMEVTINGTALGTIDLQIDHAPHREEDQSNVPTILHWGSQLGPIMRATSHIGRTVTIERTPSGAYRLTIA